MASSTRLRAITLLAGGLVLLSSGAVAGKECNSALMTCPPTFEDHGPIADVPLTAPSVPAPAPLGNDGTARRVSPLPPAEDDGGWDLRRGLTDYDPRDRLFSSSLAEKVQSLGSCRVDAARLRQARPADLPQEEVHLRLWVSFDGKVSDSVVSTTGALGPAFLDCAKRQVRDWWLIPPEGGTGAFVDVNVIVPPAGLPRIHSHFANS